MAIAMTLAPRPDRWVLFLVLLALSFLLVNCAGSSGRLPEVKPLACPVEASQVQRDEPRLPDGAGIVQPGTDAERKATGLFLTWLADWSDWARERGARGDRLAAWCGNRATQ